MDWVSSPFWLARASTDPSLLLRLKRTKSEFDLSLLLYAFAVNSCNILSQYCPLFCPDLPHCGFPRCCAHSAAKHCVQAVKSVFAVFVSFCFRINLRFERQIGREVWVDDAGVALMHEWSQPLNQNTVLWGDSVDTFILHSCFWRVVASRNWHMWCHGRCDIFCLQEIALPSCTMSTWSTGHCKDTSYKQRIVLYMHIQMIADVSCTYCQFLHLLPGRAGVCIPVLCTWFISSTAWQYRNTSWWCSARSSAIRHLKMMFRKLRTEHSCFFLRWNTHGTPTCSWKRRRQTCTQNMLHALRTLLVAPLVAF